MCTHRVGKPLFGGKAVCAPGRKKSGFPPFFAPVKQNQTGNTERIEKGYGKV